MGDHGRNWVQLGLVWLTGSISMGTVAALLVAERPGHAPALGPFRTLTELSPAEFLVLMLAFAVLFAGLLVTIAKSAEASWLPDELRGRLLWVVVVGGGGFLGWGYAATVTFMAEFSHVAQLSLAFLGGGLPFALVAAMLQRSSRVNLSATAATFVLLMAGGLVAGSSLFGVVQFYLIYLQMVLGGVYAFG